MNAIQNVLQLPTRIGKEQPPTESNYYADIFATRRAANEAHIVQKYGEKYLPYQWEIICAEKELEPCATCTGFPCSKKSNKNFTVEINVFASEPLVDIRYRPCEFETQRRFKAKVEKLKGLSRIPAEYIGKTFEDYTVDLNNFTAVKVAKKLVEMPDKGAYFFGNVGTGKTLLAAIIAQEIIKRGRQVIFATVPEISKQLRSTFKNNSKITEAEILETLENAETLVLDDIGMEKPTRFVCSTICALLNERYNSRLQTIMTSNYRLKELEAIFNNPCDGDETFDGTRIYDRCKQICVPVELKGNSRRA
jgi:DNA replication protein DnaC